MKYQLCRVIAQVFSCQHITWHVRIQVKAIMIVARQNSFAGHSVSKLH
jgi:hypothetical protein